LKIKEGQQMVIRKSLVSLAAAGLVFGSTAAAAAPVASDARSGSSVAKSDDLAGIGTFGILLGVLIVAGVIAVVASDDNNHPVSP
jgi:hypothetical protein